MIFSRKLAKIFHSLIILAISLSFIGGFVCLAQVDEAEETANIYLPESLVYDNVFWAAGENINLKSQMKDDVYLAGLNVEISGLVEGDVIAVGSNVVINSEIKGNLRVAGGSVTINGKIDKNVTIAGGMVTINKDAQIGRNLMVAGGNVQLQGKVGKNVFAGAGNLVIDSEVLGSVYASIDPEGSLILNPQANISGNLEYTAKQTAEIASGAKIGNEEKFSQWQIAEKSPANKKISLFFLTWWLAGLLGALVVGLVLVIIFKDFTLRVKNDLDKNIAMSILKGLVYLIVTPIALAILAATIIGLPLAIILAIIYAILLYLAKIFVGVYLGEKVIRLFNKKMEISLLWSMILGVAVIYILCLIPWFGWVIKLIVVLWGLGILMSIIKKDLNLENS